MIKVPRVSHWVRARVGNVVKHAAALAGIRVHLESEGRDYWEARARTYRGETESILEPGNPYFLAQQEFLRLLENISWQSALEAGCGFGWHLRAIRQSFPARTVAGLDFSYNQLREARAFVADPSVRLWQASAFSLPHQDNAFDLVFTSGVLMCVHPDRLADVLRELARVAKREVIVLEPALEHIDTPARLRIMHQASWHGHCFTPARGCGSAGRGSVSIHVVRLDPSCIPLSLFRAIKRQL